MKIISNTSKLIKYYDLEKSCFIDTDIIFGSKNRVSIKDFDSYVANGLFQLRRPGLYKAFMGLCAIPPRTNWVIDADTYEFHSEYRLRTIPLNKIHSDIEDLASSYLKKLKIVQPVIELSGGLDTSIIIDFFIHHELDFKLIGFVSDRYEFRTERKIQEYYLEKKNDSIALNYKDYPAFANLKKVCKHPIPAQESLFFNRHQTVSKTSKKIGANIVLTGEAGDQLLGFSAKDIYPGRALPIGNYYWSLAEHWSNQYVYRKDDVEYVSALAVGLLPAMILGLRSQMGLDVMKLWARNQLNKRLPSMLTDHAYKGFHDGWVCEGLILARDDIVEMAKFTSNFLRHGDLSAPSFERDISKYGQLSEENKKYFLTKLSFIVWCYSFYKDER